RGEADAIRTCGTLRAGVSSVTFGPLRALDARFPLVSFWALQSLGTGIALRPLRALLPGVSLGPRWSLFSWISLLSLGTSGTDRSLFSSGTRRRYAGIHAADDPIPVGP
ncbi:hypothetical protein, partial [Intestinimonas butyriciproducens]